MDSMMTSTEHFPCGERLRNGTSPHKHQTTIVICTTEHCPLQSNIAGGYSKRYIDLANSREWLQENPNNKKLIHIDSLSLMLINVD
jgi:hypothetical protein